MPGYDGQGPVWGGGPGAGWGQGPCGAGYRRGYGRGFGRGFGPGRGYGRGFGFRRFFSADPYYEEAPRNWTKKDELNALKEEEKMLKEELAEIQKAQNEVSSSK